MKKYSLLFACATAILVMFAANVSAQRAGGKGYNAANRNYNPATVETIKGTVIEMNTTGAWGLHVTVKTEKETINVHLGPEWFLKDKIIISKGDTITAVGSRINQNGSDVIIAKSVQKNETLVVLRDDTGVPKWSGRGNRWK
ncbi:MAG: hypothetical protein CVV44_21800 [Spirochaetae bacterium HGW-Spirochaetae-1]|jgi:hypothetical protein|nr:MAG: hypothetical protein CVV44_21800 [Spirochaetae bacterium HGW-Spirochaetae-1]